MSRLDFKLPDVGEGVTEGEIVQWFVAVGDAVAEDDPMVEVMTDKATVTIGAPCEARVERLCFEVGAVARVGQVILTLESELPTTVDSPRRSSRPPAGRDPGPGTGGGAFSGRSRGRERLLRREALGDSCDATLGRGAGFGPSARPTERCGGAGDRG